MQTKLSTQLKTASEDIKLRDSRYKTDFENLEIKFNAYTAELVAKNNTNIKDLESRYTIQTADSQAKNRT